MGRVVVTSLTELNASLDGEVVARLFDYYPDKIQITGGTLKCFCPVHKERAFRSLTLDLEQKTFKCRMKTCPCFEGGTLAELWSIYREISPEAAAHELVEQLNLDVTVAFDGVEDADAPTPELSLVDRVRQSWEQGDLSEARAHLDEAIAAEPDQLGYRLLSAELWLRASQPERAFEERLNVLDAYLEGERLDEARQLLDTMMEAGQPPMEVWARQAEWARRAEQPDDAVVALKRLADLHAQAGRPEDAMQAIERALEVNPGYLSLHEALIRLCEAQGMTDRQYDGLRNLAALYRSQGRTEAAVETLRKASELRPQDVNARTELVDALQEAGQVEEANRIRRAQVWQLIELGEASAARKEVDRLLQEMPEDTELLEARATLCQELEDAEGALTTFRRLIELADARNDAPGRAKFVQAALALAPDDVELRAEQAEAKVAAGDTEGAINDLRAVGRIMLDGGRLDEAAHCLERVRELAPKDVTSLEQLADAYERLGRQVQLTDILVALERMYRRSQDTDKNLAVLTRLNQARPEEMEWVERRLKLVTDAGRIDEAFEVRMQMAHLHDQHGEERKARKLYETLMDERPDDEILLGAVVEWMTRRPQSGAIADRVFDAVRRLIQSGHAEEGLRIARRLEEAAPEDQALDYKKRLANLYFEAHDTAAARTLWHDLALSDIREGRPEAAIEIYRRLATLDENDLESLACLVGACRVARRFSEHLRWGLKLGAAYRREGRANEAVDVYADLASHYEDHIEVWEALAELRRETGAHDQAAEAYRRLSQIYLSKNQPDRVKSALEAAHVLQPERLDVTEALGETCLTLGYDKEGVGHLAHAARTAREQNNLDQAGKLARRVLELDTHQIEIRRLLAGALEQQGDRNSAMREYMCAARDYAAAAQRPQAIDICAHLIELHWTDPMLCDLYVDLLRLEERGEDCVRYCEGLIADSEALVNEPSRLVRICRSILRFQPDHVEAHERLVDAYEAAGKPARLRRECRWLIHYFREGEGREEEGALQRAEVAYRKMLDGAPLDLDAAQGLLDLLVEGGRTDEACEYVGGIATRAAEQDDTTTEGWALGRLCEFAPDDADVLSRQADYQERTGDLSAACATRVQLVRVMLDAGQLDEARRLAEDLGAMDEMSLFLRIGLADLFEEADLPEVAAFHHFELARGALADEVFERAIEHAEYALRLKPRHIDARRTLIEALIHQDRVDEAAEQYDQLADIYYESGDEAAALQVLHELIRLNPTRVTSHRRLIELCRQMGRIDEMVDQMRHLSEVLTLSGDLDEAMECLRELVNDRPDDTRARRRFIDLYTQLGDESEIMQEYVELARVLTRKGRTSEAQRIYEQLLVQHPEELECRRWYVEFLFEQGRTQEAVTETRTLADQLLEQGRVHEASQVVDDALEQVPDQFDLLMQQANLCAEARRGGRALSILEDLAGRLNEFDNVVELTEVLERMVHIDERNVGVRRRLADLHHRQGTTDQALHHHRVLAQQYIQRDLYDLAEEQYRHMHEIQPDDDSLWEHIIETHMEYGSAGEIASDIMMFAEACKADGQLKKAIDLYRRILQSRPDDAEALDAYIEAYSQVGLEQDLVDDYLHLADLTIAQGELSRAIRIFEHLTEVCPDNDTVRSRLASAQALHESRSAETQPGTRSRGGTRRDATGAVNSARAIRNYENVLRINPRNADAHARLAGLFEAAHRDEQAHEHWVKAADSALGNGEVQRCIDVCQDYLDAHPDDTQFKSKLAQAMLQRDSLHAVDGALPDDDLDAS